MTPLMEQITREDNLVAAWQQTENRRGDEPAPTPEWDSFTEHLLTNLASIADNLHRGTWRPAPLIRVSIPKPDGRRRILHIPPLADRVAERAVLTVADLADVAVIRVADGAAATRPRRVVPGGALVGVVAAGSAW